jgi:hypothetical protein
LDSFVSHVPGYGEKPVEPIPVVPVSTRVPEPIPVDSPSPKFGDASSSRAAVKRKAPPSPPPPVKMKKMKSRKPGNIKIQEPAQDPPIVLESSEKNPALEGEFTTKRLPGKKTL